MFVIKNDTSGIIILCRECFDTFLDTIENLMKEEEQSGTFSVLCVSGDACSVCDPIDASMDVDVSISLN